MESVFFRPKHEYDSQLDPVKGYLEQITQFIATKKQISLEAATPIAVKLIKSRFQDRTVRYFERIENGDRTVVEGSLLNYIKKNIADQNILVPTFTSYMNARKKRSILSDFIDVNVKARSIAKHEAQKAKAEKDHAKATFMNNEQKNRKTANNALSGLFAQKSCIVHNPTAHSTLTSITRTMTSLSNACNERLLAGNRYLPRMQDVFRSVVYESTYVDVDEVKRVVEKYQLHLPTVEDTVRVLKRSSDLYVIDDAYYAHYIIPYLQQLTPYHLAAICYVGDLYHQRQFNSDFIRKIFSQLIDSSVSSTEPLDSVDDFKSINGDILNLAHMVNFSRIKGMGKNYEKMNSAGVARGVLESSQRIKEILLAYKDYFNCFFMKPIVPINSHRIGTMKRRVVVLSDTDSTCFTLDEWVTWYKGHFEVSDEAIAVAGVATYIASSNIINQLGILSKSMNVDQNLIGTLAMKNEFLWTVHMPSEVSKHYTAYTVFQEGSVFDEPELEIKGVHFRNSAVPVEAIQHGYGLIRKILGAVHNNQKLKLIDIINEVVALENTIYDSVLSGGTYYLKRSKIKDSTAYSENELRSPYHRHTFWEDVFADKYGPIPAPPYDVVKLPTTLDRKSKTTEWLTSIEDLGLRSRLLTWLERHSKSDLPTIYLNETYVQGSGIPAEIASVIDVRRTIFDNTLQQRVILEALGVMLDDALLVREQFSHLIAGVAK